MSCNYDCEDVFIPPPTCLPLQDGIDSKNSKTRVLCIEEMGAMLDQEGPPLYRSNRQVGAHVRTACPCPSLRPTYTTTPSSPGGSVGQHRKTIVAKRDNSLPSPSPPPQVDLLGTVARLVTERDNTLRQAVLGTMEALYCCEGDGECVCVWGEIWATSGWWVRDSPSISVRRS